MRSPSLRRGFTLIELLVVIAIIAILAAILFPVFAQARAAARGASSQSNQKQLALSVLMYVQDYDETYPLYNRWGPSGAAGFPLNFGQPFSMWTYDVQPYIKSTQVFSDPLSGTIKANSAGLVAAYVHYGFNYTALSPTNSISPPQNPTPVALAAVARPSELVMIAGRFTLEEANGSIYYYGPGTITTLGGAEPPDCSDIVPYCFADWAPDGNYSFLKTPEAGQYTGGVSLRKSGNGNFAFTDGHVKFMQPGQAAQGTNWYKGIKSGNVHITDPTKYMWQVSP